MIKHGAVPINKEAILKTITVSCRLEERYLKQLKEVTDRKERTVSWMVRRIIVEYLTQPEPPAATQSKPPRGRRTRRPTNR